MGVNIALVVLIFTISYTKAQDYVLLDEPVFNIWDSDDPNFIPETDKTHSYLCENYHLILDKEQLDCINLKLIPKAIQDQTEHVIEKRDVDETEIEGSGNGETDLTTKLPNIQNKNINKENEDTKEISKIGLTNAPNVDQEVESKNEISANGTGENVLTTKLPESLNKSIEEKKDDKSKAISVTGLSDVENSLIKVGEEAKSNTEVSSNATETQKENVQLEVKNIETAFEEAAQETVLPNKSAEIGSPNMKITSTFKPRRLEEKSPVSPPLQHIISDGFPTTVYKQSTATTVQKTTTLAKEGAKVDVPLDGAKEEQRKNPPQVLPSDLAEEEPIQEPKKSESVNDKQSGNAVLLKSPKNDATSSVEGRDGEKVLNGLRENEEIRAEPTEQPSAGQSAEKINKASKDTTVLIVLFVVVIAIGGAAFTHNYIKKRKQRVNSNSNILNGIRRSLQNLDTNSIKNNTDVEKGTELKPLMKNNSPVISNEFTDEKKRDKA